VKQVDKPNKAPFSNAGDPSMDSLLRLRYFSRNCYHFKGFDD
jgi:hypothetical protein